MAEILFNLKQTWAEKMDPIDINLLPQVIPSVTVGLADTLQIDWELTILGA